MTDLHGRRVLVVGLARSGRAAALCLRRHGAVVTVTDTRPPFEFRDVLPELVAQKIGLELGSQRQETFLRHELVVVSPGVPWDLPQLQAARERGIPILPEVEAASWFLDGKLVGVTGSNGKTTTATLLGKMLEASSFSTLVGGNIGLPLSAVVDRATPGSMIVAELSSFQLEAIQDFHPQVAVLLNLSPNHLDRHPSFEAYAQAKRQIFRNQKPEDYAILNADDPAVSSLAPALASRKVFFSRRQNLADGVFVSNGHIVYRTRHLERVLLETRDVALRGDFNLENVLAAAAAACVLGADFEALRGAVREFRGVEHRLEYVREICGVEFYNNSKATSVDAAVKSLEAFDRGVHLILGGKDKGAPYTPLRPLLERRVREVLLIGAAAERIAKQLAGAGELVHAGDLETAIRQAFKRADPGDVVLLAPACSSFDQFQDFEHRGRVFKQVVHRLAQEVEAGEAEWSKRKEVRRTSVVPPIAEVGPAPLAPPDTAEAAAIAAQAVGAGPPHAAEPQPVSEPGASAGEIEASPEPVQPAPRGAVESVEAMGPFEITERARLQEPIEPAPEIPVAEGPEPLAEASAEGARQILGPGDSPAALQPETTPVSEPPVEKPGTPSVADTTATSDAVPAKGGEVSGLERSAEEVVAGETAIAPARPSKPLELTYVYEVAAEELPPCDAEPPPQFPEEVEVATPGDYATPEGVEDEPLPFEVRVRPDAGGASEGFRLEPPGEAPGGDAPSPKAPASGAGDFKHESARSSSVGQPRLPGME